MRKFTTYKIFVGGPSDVANEIEAARDIISDISLLTKPIGLSFETFYWAEDATPGLAKEAQARINDQADGYDALIAILGAKIGSPTKDHISGTVEEIENAIDNSKDSFFRQDSVLTFFKNVSVNANDPNLKSLLLIQEFKASLGHRGILFKEFDDEIDLRHSILRSFGSLIKRHIDDIESSKELVEPVGSEPAPSEPTSDESIYDPQDDDLGIMDLDAIIAEKMSIATHNSEILTGSIELLSNKTGEYIKELTIATELKDVSMGKKILNNISDEMINCSKIIRDTVPSIKDNFDSGMKYTKRLIEIRLMDSKEDTEDDSNKGTVEAVAGMIPTSANNAEIFREFQQTIHQMPRMTKEINIAKRVLINEIGNVISLFESINKSAIEILDFYAGLKAR
ncbi:hypothetical protein [Caulobacter sp. UNC358MFTsu5.1]|uniref:hypothetical protein n=1 Tax=Caulobacter sp. UNC358MFTsu5.1 TaxID=1449049 RepID=UPI0012DFCF0D|nr:hypothetical protein [Caulobacter sp. UNC358MFTsu5.1]